LFCELDAVGYKVFVLIGVSKVKACGKFFAVCEEVGVEIVGVRCEPSDCFYNIIKGQIMFIRIVRVSDLKGSEQQR
jgi:hypothetical protein